MVEFCPVLDEHNKKWPEILVDYFSPWKLRGPIGKPLPETLMWRGIYQAGAQMPNSLPSGSVNCAHLPQGSVLSSLERVTPRALSVWQVSSILSVCKT